MTPPPPFETEGDPLLYALELLETELVKLKRCMDRFEEVNDKGK